MASSLAEIKAARAAQKAKENKIEAPVVEPTAEEREAALDALFSAAASLTGVPQDLHKQKPETIQRADAGKMQIYSPIPGSTLVIGGKTISLPYTTKSEAEYLSIKEEFNIDALGSMLRSRRL